MKIVKLEVKQRAWVDDPKGNPLYYYVVVDPCEDIKDAMRQALLKGEIIGDSVLYGYYTEDGEYTFIEDYKSFTFNELKKSL